MFVEQIRYFTAIEDLEPVLLARQAVTEVRRRLGLPPGHLMIADPIPEGGPSLVWQCIYRDEGELGAVEAQLIGNADYEEARSQLAVLIERVELEFYTLEDDAEVSA